MGLTLSYAWLLSFLLVLVRATAWLAMVPPFSDRQVIPAVGTAGVAAGMAVLIAPTVPVSSLPTTTAGLIAMIVVEILTGLAMGFVVNTLLTVFTSAGSIIDLFGGLNLPAAIDPLSLNQTPMIGQFYQQLTVVMLFGTDSNLIVVNAFARSFRLQSFSLALTPQVVKVIVADLSTLFTSALEMAGPILLVLFATQIVLALLSKAAPQMNVWLVGMPLQIFLSLMLVALNVSVVLPYLNELIERAVSDVPVMFGAH